jgi:endonuclease-3
VDPGQTALEIFERLVDTYGEPVWRPRRAPMDQLIATILSANTNDANSGRAFRQLTEAFDSDWDAIRTAPLDEIKSLIRTAGMYNQKAPHIVETLEMIKAEQGIYDLGFLGDMPVDEALAYLMRFPGVGHKTASIVLLFCFNAASFPVDTHVQRVTQRLGIGRPRASAMKVKTLWESLVPAESYYALHVNLIRHGRQVCHARQPLCERCELHDLCDYANMRGDWSKGS